VQVFLPRADTACLECTWASADYRLASAEYPCLPGGQAAVAPTGAPSYLGSFTASLMAAEAVRVLGRPREPSGDEDGAARLAAPTPEESYEIAFDLSSLVLRRFGLRRNPRCRHDHAITTEVVPAGERVADLLAALERRFGDASLRLQTRREVGRFLTVEALRARREEPLAALGLVAGDLIRVFAGDDSAWLSLAPSGGA
jgi:hypothetical protein